jgi:hypothetical protein
MESYTVVLTRGTHVVAREVGESILTALTSDKKYITADIDILCDGFVRTGVHISTAHVVAVIPNADVEDSSDEIRFSSNVSSLRPVRQMR